MDEFAWTLFGALAIAAPVVWLLLVLAGVITT